MKTLLLSISALLLTKFFLVAAHPIPQTVTPIQALESPPHNGSFVGEIDVLQNQEAAGLKTLVPENNNLEARTDPLVWHEPPIEIPQVFVPSSAGNWKLYLNVPYPYNTMGVASICSVLRYMERAMGDETIHSIVSGFQTTLMDPTHYNLTTLPQLGQEPRDPLSPSQFQTLQNNINWAVASHNEGYWLEDRIRGEGRTLGDGQKETGLIKKTVAAQVFQQSPRRPQSRFGQRVPPGAALSSYQSQPSSQPIVAAQVYQQSSIRAPSRFGHRVSQVPPPSSYADYSVSPSQPIDYPQGYPPSIRAPSRFGHRVSQVPPPSSYADYSVSPSQPIDYPQGYPPSIRAPSRFGHRVSQVPPPSSYADYSVSPSQPIDYPQGYPPSSRAPSQFGHRVSQVPPPSSFQNYYNPPDQPPPTQIGHQPDSRAPSRLGYSAIPQGPPPSSDQFNSYFTGTPASQYGPAQIGPSYTSTRHSAVPTYHQYGSHLAPSPYSMSSESPSSGHYDVDPNISGAFPTYPQYSNPAIQGNSQYGPAIPPSVPPPSTLWKRAGSIQIPSALLPGAYDMNVPTPDNKDGFNAMVELLESIASKDDKRSLGNMMQHLRNIYELYELSLRGMKFQQVAPPPGEIKAKLDAYNKKFSADQF
ncbi:hypothetical protein H0H93_004060 [Arthromyces matolae]|nr:hypothetical protein H0H93_004060 [Arthromyces matolae]